jgi:hypothetical protein
MDLLLEVLAVLENEGPVESGTMFRSPGLRTGNKIVAFLGHGDRLIVKLPLPRAAALIDDGTAEPVTMGTRTMREWVAVPASLDPGTTQDAWTNLAREALHYVQQLPR